MKAGPPSGAGSRSARRTRHPPTQLRAWRRQRAHRGGCDARARRSRAPTWAGAHHRAATTGTRDHRHRQHGSCDGHTPSLMPRRRAFHRDADAWRHPHFANRPKLPRSRPCARTRCLAFARQTFVPPLCQQAESAREKSKPHNYDVPNSPHVVTANERKQACGVGVARRQSAVSSRRARVSSTAVLDRGPQSAGGMVAALIGFQGSPSM